MLHKIITRIKQGFTFILGRYDKQWNSELHKHLKTKELLVFHNMDNYDKIHGYQLFKRVLENDILKDDVLFLKLALLHDCGKTNVSLLSRIITVILGRKSSIKHAELGYEKLKEVNLQLAELVKLHHSDTEDYKLIEFQKLDNE